MKHVWNYVSAVTEDKTKLLQQLKWGFQKTTNWNKYISKPELLRRTGNLYHLVEPTFQGMNKFFVISFENHAQRTSNKRYYLPDAEIKDYNKTT